MNYNGEDCLPDCLESLFRQDVSDFVVLVVDNASVDGSIDYLKSWKDRIMLIESRRNLGFARGNNIGIEKAVSEGAQYFVLLNNDTKTEPGWLENLLHAAGSNPDAAVCGSRILTWDGTLIENDGAQFDPLTAAGGYADRPFRESEASAPFHSAYACGASLLMRSEHYRKIGGLDADYWFYNEDVDLGLRAWIAGYKVLHIPSSLVRHRRGNFNTNSEWRDSLGMRYALQTVLKNYELTTLKQNRRRLLKIFWTNAAPHVRKAFRYNMFHLPRILKKRAAVQRLRRRSDAEMFQLIIEGTAGQGLKLGINQDIGADVTGEITREVAVKQKFKSPLDGLCRIDLFTATYMRTNRQKLQFRLNSCDGEKTVREIEIPGDQIRDNAYFSFNFQKIEKSKNRIYELMIFSPDGLPGASNTLWFDPFTAYPDSLLTLNDRPLQGTLKFRTFHAGGSRTG